MKVLILSMTVGQGHNIASNALKEALENNGHECTVLDTYKYLNKAIGLGMDKGYMFLGRKMPKFMEYIYESAYKKNGSADMKTFFPWAFADLQKAKLAKYIADYSPDVIVCTIMFTAMIVCAMQESNLIDSKILKVGIVTDFTLHPFWEYTPMDYYVSANELLIPAFCVRNIKQEQILPLGIPIFSKFSSNMPKEEACAKLNLATDKFTVLLSSGGMGFMNLYDVVEDIDTLANVQIIAICGTNKPLKDKLLATTFNNNVRVLGFVDNMPEYLDACDFYVSKPGGLSTSEAIAKCKPLLLTNPVPGVEVVNHAFLTNHSLALHCNKYTPISEVIIQYRFNDSKKQEMYNAQKLLGRKNASADLVKFLESKLEEK